MGHDTNPGDVYFLLRAGAHRLQEQYYEIEKPAFVFDHSKAKSLRVGGLEHTLLVNQSLILLHQFANLVPNRIRLDDIVHERRVRSEYKDAFKLYPDGFVRFFYKRGNKWVRRSLFLELEHTSAHDLVDWTTKTENYVNLFEYKFRTYFDLDMSFVLVLVTKQEYVQYLRHATERVLTNMGDMGLNYRPWFLFAHYDQTLSP